MKRRIQWGGVFLLGPFFCCSWGAVYDAFMHGRIVGKHHSVIGTNDPFFPLVFIGLLVVAGFFTWGLVTALRGEPPDDRHGT